MRTTRLKFIQCVSAHHSAQDHDIEIVRPSGSLGHVTKDCQHVRNHLPIYFGPGEYGDIAPHCIPPPPPTNILSKDSGHAFLSQPQTKTQTKTEAVCDVCVVFVCCFCDLRVCLNKKAKCEQFWGGGGVHFLESIFSLYE